MSKFSEEEVTVRNEFFDRIGSGYSTIGKHKWEGDKGKDSWWIFRYKTKLEEASKTYQDRKAELVEEVSMKGPGGEATRRGDMGYEPDPSKINWYEKELKAAGEVEVQIGLKKRIFDPRKIPDLNPDEWMVLWPYIANQDEVTKHMEKESSDRD